jgi:hypothetical protein
MPENWLPETEAIYLDRGQPDCRPDRPLSQGDVFDGVPLPMITKHHPERETKELGRANLVTAVLLGHTCSIRGGSVDAQLQQLAQVRPKDEVDANFAPPYQRSYFLFPLPELKGNQDWVVDLRRVGTVATRYLYGRRIACLNHDGWVAFQRRVVWNQARVDVDSAQQRLRTLETWNEVELWEEWSRRRGTAQGFQEWLDGDVGPEFGTGTRRERLAQFPDVIRGEMPQ